MKSNRVVGFIAHLRSRWYGFVDWFYPRAVKHISLRRLMLLFFAAQMTDALLTGWAVSRYGHELELNVLARGLFEVIGVWPAIALVKLGALVLAMFVLAIAHSGWIHRGKPKRVAFIGALLWLLISVVPIVLWVPTCYSLLADSKWDLAAEIVEQLRIRT